MRITLNPNQMNKMCSPVIGYEAENRVTEFEFDYSDWAADLGEGTLTLAVQRPTDTIPYPVTLTQTGENKATWVISETDLAIVGRGEFQLSYIVDEKVKKSAIYEVLIDRSLEPTGDIPDPYISWFEQIIAVGAQATQDANRAEAAADSIKDLTADATTLPAGSQATAEYDADTGVMTFGIPRGEKGETGEAGITPNIEVGNVETLETGQPAYANITGTDAEPRLNLGLPKGNTGDTGATGAPAGFGTVTATVDANTGTPSVDVTASGADTAKNFDFAFHNIKGETGDTGPQGDPGVVQDVTVNGTSVLDGSVAKVVIPEITKTVTGNPIVLSDADGEVKALNVELTPIQDLHGYDKPWAGGAGTNKFGFTVSDFDNGSIFGIGIFIKLNLSAGSYTLSTNAPTGYIWFGVNKEGDDIGRDTTRVFEGSPLTITVTDEYFAVIGILTSDKATALSYKTQLEQGTRATSWTPYENECPIYPHTSLPVRDTGKNLFDNTNPPTLITCYGSGGTAQTRKGYILNLPSGNYVSSVSWAGASAGSYIYCNIVDANGGFVRFFYVVAGTTLYTQTIALNAGEKILIFDQQADTASWPDKFGNVNIQVELGTTATSYAPYTGQTVTVPLNDLYGGTVDVIKGQDGQENMGYADLGSLSWRYNDGLFNAVIPNFAPPSAYLDRKTGFITSIYPADTQIAIGYDSMTDKTALRANGTIYIKDTSYTDVTAFKNSVTGQDICFELATPTPLTTTPTPLTLYKGNNVVSSDGDMELTYVRNLQMVIDKIESAL